MNLEHTLSGVAYGVAETVLPSNNGSGEKGYLLRFSRPDQSESWIVPMSEKVAHDIGSRLMGSSIRPASMDDLRRLSE